MADYTAGGGAFVTSTAGCTGRAGVAAAYLGRFDDIATVTETVEGTIDAITMNASTTLFEVTGEFKNTSGQAEYTRSTGTYLATVTNIRFTGQAAALGLNIARWVNDCRLVLFVVGTNGICKAYGLERFNNTLKVSIEPGAIERHYEGFGTRGNTDEPARNEFDFQAEHDYAPLNVDPTILPALI